MLGLPVRALARPLPWFLNEELRVGSISLAFFLTRRASPQLWRCYQRPFCFLPWPFTPEFGLPAASRRPVHRAADQATSHGNSRSRTRSTARFAPQTGQDEHIAQGCATLVTAPPSHSRKPQSGRRASRQTAISFDFKVGYIINEVYNTKKVENQRLCGAAWPDHTLNG